MTHLEYAAKRVNETNGTITPEQLVVGLRQQFPNDAITDRHGRHYLSMIRSGHGEVNEITRLLVK